jgi:hypothetical protein
VARLVQRFSERCLKRRRRPFPVRHREVSKFLVHYVRCNHGSAKSVGSVVSALKVYSLYNELEWLGESGRMRVAAVVRELEFQDTTPVRQVRPITMSMIDRMIRCMDLSDPLQLYVAMAMSLCHNSLMRSGELLSGLKSEDFEWDLEARSVTVHLYRTKSHRRGGPQKIRVVDFDGPSSAYKLVERWFDQWDLWAHPTWQVMPRVDNRSRLLGPQLNFGSPATAKWWRRAIGEQLVRIGVEPRFYSGHSFRAGGATDLFVAQVPYPVIKKMGRWRSDAALKYHRDEFDVAAVVASAFGRSLMGSRRSQRVEWRRV